MADCKTCEYENICEMPDFVRNNLKLCKTYTPKIKRTNSEKIRSMSDEELAEYLDNNFCHRYCCCEREQQSTLEWLQSEAE